MYSGALSLLMKENRFCPRVSDNSLEAGLCPCLGLSFSVGKQGVSGGCPSGPSYVCHEMVLGSNAEIVLCLFLHQTHPSSVSSLRKHRK